MKKLNKIEQHNQNTFLVILVIFLCISSVAVRLLVLDKLSLHPDEAIYAAYALHISKTGDLFLNNWVGFPLDKHPLFLWAVSISIAIFGDGVLAIRLVSLLAETLSTALVILITRKLSDTRSAFFSGSLYCFSILGAGLGATVFFEPFSVILGLIGIYLVINKKLVVSGALIALSGATKLFGLIYLPVTLGILNDKKPFKHSLTLLLSFTCVIVVLLLVPILLQNTSNQSSYISNAIININLGLADFPKYISRFLYGEYSLLHQANFMFKTNTGNFLAFIGTIGSFIWFNKSSIEVKRFLISSWSAIIIYFVGLIAISTPIFDRYFLYTLPLICIGAGIGLGKIIQLIKFKLLKLSISLIIFSSLAISTIHYINKMGLIYDEVGSRPASGYFGGYGAACKDIASYKNINQVWSHSLSHHLAYCLQESSITRLWFREVRDISNYPNHKESLLLLSKFDNPGVIEELNQDGWSLELINSYGGIKGTDIWLYRIYQQ